MADPYVIFPDTPGVNIQTDDVTLLDADTAHLVQGHGEWSVDYNRVVSSEAQMGWKFQYLFAATQSMRTVPEAFPLTASTLHTVGMFINTEDSLDQTYITVLYYDSGGAQLSSDVLSDINPTPTGRTWRSGEFTPPANTVSGRLYVYYRNGDDGGITNKTLESDSFMVAEGSVPAFVPSLRIVGTLYEETVPADMPVVFAGDGTPLTVGEGWAGNGYSYRRYDGPDSSAPLVASFQAGDIPVAAQLPG